MCLMLACALCACALCACGSPKPAPTARAPEDGTRLATAVPEEGVHGEQDQSAALRDMPTLEPVVPIGDGASDDYYSIDALIAGTNTDDASAQQAQPAPQETAGSGRLNTDTYQYSALIDTSLGFTFNYPSHWQNVPGVFTVCFREQVEPGDFPARVAITAKKLVHSPEGTVLEDELSAYVRTISKQYEPKTFQAGTPNYEDTFLGKQAASNTYLAYSGEKEVKGFIIARAVKRTLYVFHFCATYEDYGAMESMMRYMVRSVELVGDD